MSDNLQHAGSASESVKSMFDAVQAGKDIRSQIEAVESGDIDKLLKCPIFHFITESGVAKIFVNGMSEGLPDGTAILNGAYPLILALCGRIEQLEAALIAGKQP